MADVVIKSNKKILLGNMEKQIEKANVKIGYVVQGEVIQNTPIRTGNLAKSTAFKTGGGAGSAPVDARIGQVAIGWFTDYASAVHDGTARMEAHPAIRNAIITKAAIIANIYAKEIK